MSVIDGILDRIEDNGGIECICRKTPKDKAVEFIKDGKTVYHYHKECPVHGITSQFLLTNRE